MALLQISEPGMSTAPHQRRLAVGIDLGTTNSLVATVRSGSAEVLANEDGDKLLPSIVGYRAGRTGALIGQAAREQQASDPANTISSFKRFMGRSVEDVPYRADLPYQFHTGPGMLQIDTVAGLKSPVEMSAEILATLRQLAEDALGDELVGAVITVPAYFDDAQRQATKDAARLAGLNVLRLLNEPTAAAVAYGLDSGLEGVYAVYDLGGGTFDVSILRLSRGLFEVMATGGDSALGGDDFDHAVYSWILQEIRPASGSSAADCSCLSVADSRALLTLARSAKESLTDAAETLIRSTLENGQQVELRLTREKFDALTAPLLQRTLDAARRTLDDAGIRAADVQGIVLVGGSTRMPCVQSATAAFFDRQPLCSIDPDEVVALGAAMQANLLAGNRANDEDWLLLDVIPLSLGIETMGELVEKIIPRNSTIPCARAQDFTTFKDGQTALAVHVLQGEREIVEACRSLARFELRGIPPMAAGAARIRVTYQVDADGLLQVFAREQTSGVEASIVVKPSYGLEDDQITRMLADSNQSAAADMEARALREEQVEARRTLLATESALASDGSLLSDTEQAAVNQLIQNLRALVESTDRDAIHAALQALADGTEEFAARRMDRSVRQVLSGKRLDEI